MDERQIVRRSIAARGEFTSSCRRAWIDHAVGDLDSDSLEAAFGRERIKMLRAVMEILPASEDDDPAFVGETLRPAVGTTPSGRWIDLTTGWSIDIRRTPDVDEAGS